jgi:hypothetical protein
MLRNWRRRASRNVFDERPADAAAPQSRLDEQSVKLAICAVDRQRGRKSGRPGRKLCDADLAPAELFDRNVDRVRIGQQRVAIIRPNERGAPLQFDQSQPFAHKRKPNCELHAACLNKVGSALSRAAKIYTVAFSRFAIEEFVAKWFV